jgi:hypothetical protein
MDERDADRVECYSGHIYAQEPRAVIWHGHRYPVARIEERWRTPEGPAFRVQVESEQVFELRHHEAEDCWTIRELEGLT